MKKTISIFFTACILFSLFINVMAAEAIQDERPLLSELSPEECLTFIKNNGVTVPDEFQNADSLPQFVKAVIEQVEQQPYCSLGLNSPTAYQFANDIRDVVNAYYGVSTTASASNGTGVRSGYILQDSIVDGMWTVLFERYNCYGYAIGKLVKIYPGYYSGKSFSIANSIYTHATYTEADLKALGYPCVRLTTTRPSSSSLTDGQKAICIRKGEIDFHYMKLDGSDWYHKPGETHILKYKYNPTTSRIWTNERSVQGVALPPTTEYTSAIYYIIYSANHSGGEAVSYTGNNYHSGSKHYAEYKYECACGETYTAYISYPCTGNPCIMPAAIHKEIAAA